MSSAEQLDQRTVCMALYSTFFSGQCPAHQYLLFIRICTLAPKAAAGQMLHVTGADTEAQAVVTESQDTYAAAFAPIDES